MPQTTTQSPTIITTGYKKPEYKMPPSVEHSALQHDLQNYRERLQESINDQEWEQELFFRGALRKVEKRIAELEVILEANNEQ